MRGSRILLSAIPYIVDRAQEIDPIKVTLQVSHKGMKIVQVTDAYYLRAEQKKAENHFLPEFMNNAAIR